MKKKIIITIVIAVILIGATVMWRNKEQKQIEQKRMAEAIEREIVKKASAINGTEVAEAIAKRRPIAVMIENHPDSRPQYGLSEADIIYETLAEGGITRFMALFQTNEPKRIGPVRSTRPYFNLLANQWLPLFAHSGGSDSALKELANGYYRSIVDGDEMLNGKYYTRDYSKLAPHNLFSTGEDLQKLVEAKKLNDWKFTPFLEFKSIPTDQLKSDVNEITIPFSTASYLVKWTFDPTSNTYKRVIGGKPSVDGNSKEQIAGKNIIVQFATGNVISGDPKLAMEFRLDRQGTAYLFTGGGLTPGNWKYENGHTVFSTKAGQQMEFQPGQTWIEIVPSNIQNTVTWK